MCLVAGRGRGWERRRKARVGEKRESVRERRVRGWRGYSFFYLITTKIIRMALLAGGHEGVGVGEEEEEEE